MLSVVWEDGRAHASGLSHYRRGHDLSPGTERDQSDGLRAEWSWDGRTLTAKTDEYGLHPIYYFHDGRRFAISTNPLKILAAGFASPVDFEALGLFLRMSNFFGSDTPWSKIKAMPPNATLTMSAEGLRVVGGPPPGPRAIEKITHEEALDGFVDRVAEAVRRRPPISTSWVHPLSGGRDSRHLLLELCKQGHRPKEAVTWAPFRGGGGREAQAAGDVARALGIPHTRVTPTRSFTSYEFDKNLDTGFCAPDHYLFIPLREYMCGRTECIYDGIAGDVLSQDSFMTIERRNMFAQGRFEELALDHFRTMGLSEASLRWLVGEDAYRRMPIEGSITKFVDSCRVFRDHPRGYTLWTFYTRTTRMVGLAPYHIFRDIATVYAPYLDRDVFEFMTAIPAEIVRTGHFHDDAIARAYPEFASLPYAASPSRTVKYQLSPGAQWATLRDLAAMSGANAPRRLPSLARWALSPVLKGPGVGVPRKWMTYWLQFEAIMQAGAHELDRPIDADAPSRRARPAAAGLGFVGAAYQACDLLRVLDM